MSTGCFELLSLPRPTERSPGYRSARLLDSRTIPQQQGYAAPGRRCVVDRRVQRPARESDSRGRTPDALAYEAGGFLTATG